MTKTEKFIVECPFCGSQYIPGEIYYPKYFFGNIKNVVKDGKGQIISYYCDKGIINEEESYTCDFCNKPFTVQAKISFCTKPDEEADFSVGASEKACSTFTLPEE